METPWRVSGLVAALAFAGAVHADGLSACFKAAGQRYGMAPALLRAIARVESGLDAAATNTNADGSTDIGLMQINSWWLPVLRPYGIGPQALLDPCLNIDVGAWILAGDIRRFGYGWRAVGAYHAGTGTGRATERRRERYAMDVYQHLHCPAHGVCFPAARAE